MNVWWIVFFHWIHRLANANDACPDDWISLGGKCYFFSTAKKTWYNAATTCPLLNDHLVYVNNFTENELLRRHIQDGATYWIHLRKQSYLGGNLTTRRQEWKWVGGPEYSWNNWGENLPTAYYQYSVITSTGKWEDKPGGEHHFYICEKIANGTSHDTSTAPTQNTNPSTSSQNGLYMGVGVAVPVIVIIAGLIIIAICMMRRRKLRGKKPSASEQKKTESTSAEMTRSNQEHIDAITPEVRVESPYNDIDSLSISSEDERVNGPSPTELAEGAPADGNHPQPVYAMVDKTQKVNPGRTEDNPVISDVYAVPN